MSAPTETALGLTESRSAAGRALKVLTYLLVLVVFAGPLLALLPSVIVFLFFQRSFVHGLSSGALKG
ncbi:hypothetical protein ACFVDH_33970 [Streptomyces sp. NPDC057674]|uniref:hypothetical protein n=1 Tax=Streptomyces sp. NPDC057674 TaxID=3346203 RepID=UPI0036C3324F